MPGRRVKILNKKRISLCYFYEKWKFKICCHLIFKSLIKDIEAKNTQRNHMFYYFVFSMCSVWKEIRWHRLKVNWVIDTIFFFSFLYSQRLYNRRTINTIFFPKLKKFFSLPPLFPQFKNLEIRENQSATPPSPDLHGSFQGMCVLYFRARCDHRNLCQASEPLLAHMQPSSLFKALPGPSVLVQMENETSLVQQSLCPPQLRVWLLPSSSQISASIPFPSPSLTKVSRWLQIFS